MDDTCEGAPKSPLVAFAARADQVPGMVMIRSCPASCFFV
jgi:hypothetical protein